MGNFQAPPLRPQEEERIISPCPVCQLEAELDTTEQISLSTFTTLLEIATPNSLLYKDKPFSSVLQTCLWCTIVCLYQIAILCYFWKKFILQVKNYFCNFNSFMDVQINKKEAGIYFYSIYGQCIYNCLSNSIYIAMF